MILIVENYSVPCEKIRNILYPSKIFKRLSYCSHEQLKKLNDLIFNNDVNFSIREEQFDTVSIRKIEYYFDQICRVDGSFLRILNKKKRSFKIYDIIRNEKEIIDFREIRENMNSNECRIGNQETAKPYLDAQEQDEVVVYPSDEE